MMLTTLLTVLLCPMWLLIDYTERLETRECSSLETKGITIMWSLRIARQSSLVATQLCPIATRHYSYIANSFLRCYLFAIFACIEAAVRYASNFCCYHQFRYLQVAQLSESIVWSLQALIRYANVCSHRSRCSCKIAADMTIILFFRDIYAYVPDVFWLRIFFKVIWANIVCFPRGK